MSDVITLHRELRRKGVTLQLRREEYAAAHADQPTCRYTQFVEHYRSHATIAAWLQISSRCQGSGEAGAPLHRKDWVERRCRFHKRYRRLFRNENLLTLAKDSGESEDEIVGSILAAAT
nr:hypothetical protein [Pseudomonas agarici]